jgi:hypothetical protein
MLMLATSCKAAIKNAKSHLFDPAKRKVALQQLQFSDRIISGIAEALRREQTGVQIEDHLANILVGLTRLKKELSSGTAAPTPMPTPTEDLKGSDWMSALRQIRTRLEDGVVQEQIKIPDTLDPRDMQLLNNINSVKIDFLDDQPYGLITAPILVVRGRVDNTARTLLAKENFDYYDFMREYFVIDNASCLGVLAEHHEPQFVKEALEYTNQHHARHLSLCGIPVREGNHFYYLLMPERVVRDNNAAIAQWIFQKS